jgi:hypothetical protein
MTTSSRSDGLSSPSLNIYISAAGDLPQVCGSFPRGAQAGFELEKAVQKNGQPARDLRALEEVLRSDFAGRFVAALAEKKIAPEEVLGRDCAAVLALLEEKATQTSLPPVDDPPDLGH